MNAKKATKNQTTKFVAFNPITRKMEEVYEESELPVGSSVIKAFWADTKWVTIPGASLHIVTADGWMLDRS